MRVAQVTQSPSQPESKELNNMISSTTVAKRCRVRVGKSIHRLSLLLIGMASLLSCRTHPLRGPIVCACPAIGLPRGCSQSCNAAGQCIVTCDGGIIPPDAGPTDASLKPDASYQVISCQTSTDCPALTTPSLRETTYDCVHGICEVTFSGCLEVCPAGDAALPPSCSCLELNIPS